MCFNTFLMHTQFPTELILNNSDRLHTRYLTYIIIATILVVVGQPAHYKTYILLQYFIGIYARHYAHCRVSAIPYARICTYVRTYMYVRTHVCMYVRAQACMYARAYVCTYVRMYVRTHVRTEHIRLYDTFTRAHILNYSTALTADMFVQQ